MTERFNNIRQEYVDISAVAMFPKALKALENVTKFGGQKHGYSSWKDKDNPSLQHKANFASACRHLADWYAGITKDHESGEDPRLHAVWRLLASYERDQNFKGDNNGY